jgi:glycerate-2-kinase
MRITVRQPRVRALLHRLLKAGLRAVDPGRALRSEVRREGHLLRVGNTRRDLRRYRRVVAVGAGKASARMAAALETVLGDNLDGGLVVVKYGHAVRTRKVRIVEAGHPVPDRAGQRAAARVLELVGGLTSDDLLLVLLSGGASSLLAAPAPGLTIRDKQSVSRLLLRSGATIQEINTVRKHLSAIKGGRLAAATRAEIVGLILSDVIGDDLGSIGSGPTAPDPTTYADARSILRRYALWERVPLRVRSHLLTGARRRLWETPKPKAPLFARVRNHLIGSNRRAVEAVARAAAGRGIRPLVLSTSLIGEARDIAKVFGAIAREIADSRRPAPPPVCVIAGGELTVTVRGSGRGGRAQEFALAAAGEIVGLPNTWVAGFGTDGSDGPTGAAGAVSDGGTWARAKRAGSDPVAALLRNDAYSLFRRCGGHIITGPTGTNVNDLYLLLAL